MTSTVTDILKGMSPEQFSKFANEIASEHRERHGPLGDPEFDNLDLGSLSDNEFASVKSRVFAKYAAAAQKKAVESAHEKLDTDGQLLSKLAAMQQAEKDKGAAGE